MSPHVLTSPGKDPAVGLGRLKPLPAGNPMEPPLSLPYKFEVEGGKGR